MLMYFRKVRRRRGGSNMNGVVEYGSVVLREHFWQIDGMITRITRKTSGWVFM
jgi:hypothetical protein